MLKALLATFLLISFVCGNALATPAACRAIVAGDSAHDRRDLPTLGSLVIDDGLPFMAKRLSRQVDAIDIDLLRDSYDRAYSVNEPIEMGIVELLDVDGNLIASQYVQGHTYYINGINEVAIRLVSTYFLGARAIKTVRLRHTHPQNSRGNVISMAFSPADLKDDAKLRGMLDQMGNKNIRLEAWISFMEDESFRRSSEISAKNSGTRGYLVR